MNSIFQCKSDVRSGSIHQFSSSKNDVNLLKVFLSFSVHICDMLPLTYLEISVKKWINEKSMPLEKGLELAYCHLQIGDVNVNLYNI